MSGPVTGIMRKMRLFVCRPYKLCAIWIFRLHRCELLLENIYNWIRFYLLISTCNYPRKERIYAGAFLFQKIRTQCPKSAIRTGCKVGGKSARLYLDNFTAAARGIPAATDSRRWYEPAHCLIHAQHWQWQRRFGKAWNRMEWLCLHIPVLVAGI